MSDEFMNVFFSYKVENSNLVRGVAERLTANDFNIWFAEYVISFGEYDDPEPWIRKGIQWATHAVIYTNSKWAGSDWCKMEMDQIRKRIGIEDIIEVGIPMEGEPVETYPWLLPELRETTERAIAFTGNVDRPSRRELDELAFRIADKLGCRVNMESQSALGTHTPVSLPRFGLSLDTGPLKPMYELSAQFVRTDPVSFAHSILFRGHVEGVEVTLKIDAHPYRSVIEDLGIDQAGFSDERQVFSKYFDYARDWAERSSGVKVREETRSSEHLQPVGIHLVFDNGRSHFGLTSRQTTNVSTGPLAGTNLDIWERRYVFSVRDRIELVEGDGRDSEELRSEAAGQARRHGEVRLVFYFNSPGGKDPFRTFCSLCPHFDEIAETIEYEVPAGRTAFMNSLPIVIAKCLYFSGACYLVYHLIISEMLPWTMGAAFVLFGVLLMDLVMFAKSHFYRRLMWLKQPLYEDVLQPGTYERFSTNTLNWLMGNPISLFSICSYFGGRGRKLGLLSLLALLTALVSGATVWLYPQPECRSLTVLLSGVMSMLFGFFLCWSGIDNYLATKSRPD
jgi:hypothetical protein